MWTLPGSRCSHWRWAELQPGWVVGGAWPPAQERAGPAGREPCDPNTCRAGGRAGPGATFMVAFIPSAQFTPAGGPGGGLAEGQEKILDVQELVQPTAFSCLQSGGLFATPKALGKRL